MIYDPVDLRTLIALALTLLLAAWALCCPGCASHQSAAHYHASLFDAHHGGCGRSEPVAYTVLPSGRYATDARYAGADSVWIEGRVMRLDSNLNGTAIWRPAR